MKIRNGFVSNSSSSSFIVAFRRLPKSVEETKKMLFGDVDRLYCYDESASAWDVASRVFDDLGKQSEPNFKTLLEEAENGSICYDDLHAMCSAANGERVPNFHDFYEIEEKKIKRRLEEKYGVVMDVYAVFRDEKKYSEKEREYWRQELDKAHERANQKGHREIRAFLKKWLSSVSGASIRLFHYSDNEGETLLEHGNIFAAVSSIRISQH